MASCQEGQARAGAPEKATSSTTPSSSHFSQLMPLF
jgi:hypothetical protein